MFYQIWAHALLHNYPPGGKAEMITVYIVTDSKVTPYYHMCRIPHEPDLRPQGTKIEAEVDGTAE